MNMHRGDTAYLMLNYTINGDPLIEGAYQEIELQLNDQTAPKSIKKLLSDNTIRWGTLTYEDDGVEKTFTGYYCSLSQDETFKFQQGLLQVQLRILVNDEVGSSDISSITLGQTLSRKVLV